MRNYKYKGIKISKKSTILEIYKKEIITIFATATIMVATYLWYYFNLELITVSKLILFYVICLLSTIVIYDITCYFISLYKALYLPITDHECNQLNINSIDEYTKFIQKFLFGYRPVLKIRKKIGYFLYKKYGYKSLMKTDIFLLRRGNGLTLKFILLDIVILFELFLYNYDIKKLLFISIGMVLGIIIFTYKKYNSSFTDYCIFIEWIESVFDVKVVNKNGLYSISGLDIECKSLQKLYRILLLRKDIGRRIPNVEEKKVQEVFYAPIKGKVKEITETPDPTFAQKIMGDGVVIIPEEGKVYAPCDGSVGFVFDTKHAIGLRSKEGVEILIHIGIDTVKLNGEGFTVHVKDGQEIKQGDLLMEMDLAFLKENAPSIATPIVFTNLSKQTLNIEKYGKVEANEKLICIE